MGSYTNDIAKVAKDAEEQGFKVTRTTRGHYQFYSPNKRDIVVTGGTPGGGRHWENFMAEMKRAGFQSEDERPAAAATTLLGDAMAEAARQAGEEARLHVALKAQAVGRPKPRVGPGISAIVLDALRSRGEAGATFDELCLIATARKKAAGGEAVSRGTTSAALSILKDKGDARQTARGHWVIVSPSKPAEGFSPATSGAAAEPAAMESVSQAPPVKEVVTAPPTGGAPEPPPIMAGVSVTENDAMDDADLAAIEKLLEALSEAEGAIRRNREFVLRRRELRRVLAQLGALVKLGSI